MTDLGTNYSKIRTWVKNNYQKIVEMVAIT